MQSDLRNEIIEYLQNRKGDYGFYYRDLKSGNEIGYNENTIFPAASIIKIPIMIEFFRQSEKNLIDKDELIALPVANRVGGAGILHELRDDIKMKLSELVLLMIILSDNTATNLVIDILGIDNINKFLNKRDYKSCLQRKMMDFTAQKEGKENYITAKEIGLILKDIYNNDFAKISKNSCDEILSIMTKQTIRDKLSFYIPEDDWPKIASKTGTLDKVEHDASIFNFSNKKFVLVLLSKNLPTNAYGNITIAKTAKKICGL